MHDNRGGWLHRRGRPDRRIHHLRRMHCRVPRQGQHQRRAEEVRNSRIYPSAFRSVGLSGEPALKDAAEERTRAVHLAHHAPNLRKTLGVNQDFCRSAVSLHASQLSARPTIRKRTGVHVLA